MKIVLENAQTGQRVITKEGFSWTTLFFGALVPLFRGDFVWFLVSLVGSGVTLGLFWLVFPFIYNRIYINKMIDKGYRRVAL